MQGIAKVVIFDLKGSVLRLTRSGTHPKYPHDIDLPGGILDGDETPVEGALREVLEETGLNMQGAKLELVKKQFAHWGAVEYLFAVTLAHIAPRVCVSWEHEAWEWAPRDAVMTECNSAADSYMNLAGEYLQESSAHTGDRPMFALRPELNA